MNITSLVEKLGETIMLLEISEKQNAVRQEYIAKLETVIEVQMEYIAHLENDVEEKNNALKELEKLNSKTRSLLKELQELEIGIIVVEQGGF